MSSTAILCLVLVSLITGFVAGYITGRSTPPDDGLGHPHDFER